MRSSTSRVFRFKKRKRSDGLRRHSASNRSQDLITPRNPNNTNGFQGAHIIGDKFWTRALGWITQNLGADFNQNSSLNGVLLPEGNRGGAVLGTAEHFGNHVDAFDGLFYDQNAPQSNKYLNVLERRLNNELLGVNDPERIARIAGDSAHNSR
ncbi:AHH domain-containing protein [Bradyrhizobium liaoningense]|nr:AHH domain-containing protein [Bradyrhizobium liaoningense]